MKTIRFNSKPPEERSPFWWLRWVPTVVVSGLTLYFLYFIGRVAIIPVLASFALAYLLNPIVYQGEKRGLSRTAAAIVAIVLIGLAIAAFSAFVIPDLWDESSRATQTNSRRKTRLASGRGLSVTHPIWNGAPEIKSSNL